MNVIIFGPPGAGKGTQAQLIAKKFNLYQVSTGDLLRDEIKKKTEIGKEIENIISKGDFVSDSIINKLLTNVITNSLYRNRIIFDGYPRTISQAEKLEIILNSNNQSLNFVLSLNVTREIISKRISSRVICEKCNKTFNENDDKNEIENHNCGNKYIKKRNDDNHETVLIRHEEYLKKTKPVLDFYSSRSYFYEIDGSQKIVVIADKIEQILRV